MEQKNFHHAGYSRTSFRTSGKNPSHASSTSFKHLGCSTSLYSAVVSDAGNITKPKDFNTLSQTSLIFKYQNPSTIFAAPIHLKKTHSTQVSPSLQQYQAFDKRINGKIKDIQKSTLKAIFRSSIHEFSKDDNLEIPQNIAKKGAGVVGNKTKQKAGCRNFYAPTISSTQRLIATRTEKKGFQNLSKDSGARANKCSLKSYNYSSTSKAIPLNYSHSTSVLRKRDAIARKMYDERPALRISSTTESSKTCMTQNSNVSTLSTVIASDMARKNMLNNHNLVAVVGPPRITRGFPANGCQRRSLTDAIIQVPDPRTSSSSRDNFFSATFRLVSGLKNLSRLYTIGKPTESYALGSLHALCNPYKNTKAQSCNNLERTVEPESIRERINHNQEPSYENVLESGSNLFLRRLNFHDQHREMRMDIDNMSYEELLELEEKMGSVSTGLTDEALSKCLKRSSFKRARFSAWHIDCTEDSNRCSICQEECAVGDNVGELSCEHWYHVVCIQQWLKQKNWCPICKTPAYGQILAG